MSQPLLGIMAIYLDNRRFEELPYFRKLALRGSRIGLRVMVFSPEDADASREKIYGLFYHPGKRRWFRRWSPFPDVVYDRCRNQQASRFYQLKEFRAKYPHLTYLNRPLSNKWGIYQVLSGHEEIRPHLPFTVKFTSFAQLTRLLGKRRTLYLKPSNGTGGRGIVRVRRSPGGRLNIQGRDITRRIIPNQTVTARQLAVKIGSWPLKAQYLIQQGIDLSLPDGRVHDYRMLMQKDDQGNWDMTGCAGRIGPALSITSNLHGGGSAVSMDRLLAIRFSSSDRIKEIKRDAERLGHNVVAYLEEKYGKLCELGLDIAIDRRGNVWLLEINPKPSREVFRRIGEKETYERAIARPLQYALWVYAQKSGDA